MKGMFGRKMWDVFLGSYLRKKVPLNGAAVEAK